LNETRTKARYGRATILALVGACAVNITFMAMLAPDKTVSSDARRTGEIAAYVVRESAPRPEIQSEDVREKLSEEPKAKDSTRSVERPPVAKVTGISVPAGEKALPKLDEAGVPQKALPVPTNPKPQGAQMSQSVWKQPKQPWMSTVNEATVIEKGVALRGRDLTSRETLSANAKSDDVGHGDGSSAIAKAPYERASDKGVETDMVTLELSEDENFDAALRSLGGKIVVVYFAEDKRSPAEYFEFNEVSGSFTPSRRLPKGYSVEGHMLDQFARFYGMKARAMDEFDLSPERTSIVVVFPVSEAMRMEELKASTIQALHPTKVIALHGAFKRNGSGFELSLQSALSDSGDLIPLTGG